MTKPPFCRSPLARRLGRAGEAAGRACTQSGGIAATLRPAMPSHKIVQMVGDGACDDQESKMWGASTICFHTSSSARWLASARSLEKV
eukprot:CAMPEP_0117556154 /NCGR_PEP_ID=MMETSP0784-20121206/51654_1 /TAXON_ID=39447 /ORGANISM="" /LENGTH=87 /DNA_ID=CAMNT_0005353403 /DNA_START=32 /DNA_END=295 /DNA_ORIENTATION=+